MTELITGLFIKTDEILYISITNTELINKDYKYRVEIGFNNGSQWSTRLSEKGKNLLIDAIRDLDAKNTKSMEE